MPYPSSFPPAPRHQVGLTRFRKSNYDHVGHFPLDSSKLYFFWGGLGTRMYTTIVLMRCDGDGLSPIQLESLKDFQNARHCKEAFTAIPTDFNNYEVDPSVWSAMSGRRPINAN